MRKLIPLVALVVLSGCKINPGKNPDPAEISGRIPLPGGETVTGLTLNLQPTGTGTEAIIPLKNGEFRAKVTPGRYTYYIGEGQNPAAFRTVPKKYHAGSMDRQV